MRRRALFALLTLCLAMLYPATSSAGPISAAPGPQRAPLTHVDPGVGGFMSPNVSYVATLPIDSPGIGARVVQVGAQKRLYVTGGQSLTIYDVTNPAIPLILGRLELPNFENEDVAVSADGNTVLISDYLGGYYLYVIDTTLVAAPRIVGELLVGDFGHIVSCIDPQCDWVYGSEGSIIDLHDKTKPVRVPGILWGTQVGLTSGQTTNGHNIEVDSAGYVWSDTTPITMMDVSDRLHPKRVTSGKSPAGANTAYQHNNIRPLASAWQPREALPVDATEEQIAEYNKLRPGEILLSNGETNFSPRCGAGSGPFATYSVRDFDKGAPITHIESFRPVNGTYDGDGNPAVNAMGCSGHWFTWRNGIVAAGWYEHGTRFLKVDQETGHISQLGYFQPVVGAASAAHWIDDEYVYVVDYERGIDILRFNRAAPVPTRKQFRESWLAKLGVVDPLAKAERFACTYRTVKTPLKISKV
jgi:hypothetical protein